MAAAIGDLDDQLRRTLDDAFHQRRLPARVRLDDEAGVGMRFTLHAEYGGGVVQDDGSVGLFPI